MKINKDLINSLINFVGQELQNDKWITVHPNGEDEKGRPLLIKDGENLADALTRQYGGVKGQRKLDFKGAEKKYQEEQAKKKIEIKKEGPKPKEEPKKQTSKAEASPFGEGVEIQEHNRKGMFLSSKNLKSYKKGDRFAIVDDWSDENNKRFSVKLGGSGVNKHTKVYITEKGMQKAIREHLAGDSNKETKALETKTSLADTEKAYKDVKKRYNDAYKKVWGSERGNLTTAEYHKAYDEMDKAKRELTKVRREYAESIMSNFEVSSDTSYEDRQQARKERYEALSEQAQKESNAYAKRFSDWAEAVPLGQPTISKQFASARKKAAGLIDREVAAYKKAGYYADKAASVGKAGISADDANAIAKLAQKYKSGVTSAEKRRIIDRVIDIHKNSQAAKTVNPSEDYSHLGFNVERNADLNRLQLKFGGIPDASVRSVLKSNGFRWSPSNKAWQRQSGSNAEASLKRVAETLSMKDKATSTMA